MKYILALTVMIGCTKPIAPILDAGIDASVDASPEAGKPNWLDISDKLSEDEMWLFCKPFLRTAVNYHNDNDRDNEGALCIAKFSLFRQR